MDFGLRTVCPSTNLFLQPLHYDTSHKFFPRSEDEVVMALTTFVGLLCLFPLLLVAYLRLALTLTGRSLKSQSQDKRDILRALFKRDIDLGSSVNIEEVDNGWEKVATPPLKAKQDEWSGIIGFFHPFWCAALSIRLRRHSLMLTVMLAAVENEFCGLPSKLHRSNILKLSAQSIQATTISKETP